MFSNYKQRLTSFKPFNIFREMFVHSLMSAIILRSTLHTEDCIYARMTLHKCTWLHIHCQGIKDKNLRPLSSSQKSWLLLYLSALDFIALVVFSCRFS